ncbi:MAG: transcriptional regulator [Deltaproteobacteria bacterium]|nr:transcriptional regulator [Deltaproteobacteria bacterium]
MKLIKRYSNRKLYDTERSSYVTLEEISQMVRDGSELRIVDNKSGEDITSVTLAQIVFEQEKKDKRTLPMQALRDMIRSPSDFISRLSRDVSDMREDAKSQVEKVKRTAAQQQADVVAPVREFLDSIPRALEEVQARIDLRIGESFEQLKHLPETVDQVKRLKAEVARLQKKLADADRRAKNDRADFDIQLRRLDIRLKALETKPK